MFYEKRGLLTSKIPVLRIHTIKTSLIVRISISTFFSGSKKPYYYRISKKIQLGFSSKKKVPQLGSARNLHSSARAGKFRLGLITRLFAVELSTNFKVRSQIKRESKKKLQWPKK